MKIRGGRISGPLPKNIKRLLNQGKGGPKRKAKRDQMLKSLPIIPAVRGDILREALITANGAVYNLLTFQRDKIDAINRGRYNEFYEGGDLVIDMGADDLGLFSIYASSSAVKVITIAPHYQGLNSVLELYEIDNILVIIEEPACKTLGPILTDCEADFVRCGINLVRDDDFENLSPKIKTLYVEGITADIEQKLVKLFSVVDIVGDGILAKK